MIIDLGFVIFFGVGASAAVRWVLAPGDDLDEETIGRFLGGLFLVVWGVASVSEVTSGADGWWRWALVDAAAFTTAIYTLRPPGSSGEADGSVQARDGELAMTVEPDRPAAADSPSWVMKQAIAYIFLAVYIYTVHEAFARIVGQVRVSTGLDTLGWTSDERLAGEFVVFAFGMTASLVSVGVLLMLLNRWLHRNGELIAGWRHQRLVLLLIAAGPVAACLILSLEQGSLLGGVLLRLSLLFHAFWRGRDCPPERATDFLKSPWLRPFDRVRRSVLDRVPRGVLVAQTVAPTSDGVAALRLQERTPYGTAEEPRTAVEPAPTGVLGALLVPIVAALVIAVAAPVAASRPRAASAVVLRVALAALAMWFWLRRSNSLRARR